MHTTVNNEYVINNFNPLGIYSGGGGMGMDLWNGEQDNCSGCSFFSRLAITLVFPILNIYLRL